MHLYNFLFSTCEQLHQQPSTTECTMKEGNIDTIKMTEILTFKKSPAEQTSTGLDSWHRVRFLTKSWPKSIPYSEESILVLDSAAAHAHQTPIF